MFKFSFNQPNNEKPSTLPTATLSKAQQARASKVIVDYQTSLRDRVHHFVSICDGELTLRKSEAIAPSHLSPQGEDIIPNQYEGGYKLWEGAIDLAEYLHTQHHCDGLFHSQCQVLELGAGHALPAIVAAKCGSRFIALQDYNEDVIRDVTAPNMKANVSDQVYVSYYSGGWDSLPEVIDHSFDIILAAETIYAQDQVHALAECVLKLLNSNGVAFVAGKKYYFGVGGGMEAFNVALQHVAQRLNVSVQSQRVSEIRDGASNVREIVRVSKMAI